MKTSRRQQSIFSTTRLVTVLIVATLAIALATVTAYMQQGQQAERINPVKIGSESSAAEPQTSVATETAVSNNQILRNDRILSPDTALILPTGDGGFETGVDFPTNGWTVVNGANNRLFVGAAPVCSAGARCAFSGVDAVTWLGEAPANVNHFYRDIAFPPGEANISLSFKYKLQVVDATFDFLKVFLVPTSTTPVAGTQLASGQVSGTLDSALAYTTINITLPQSAAGTTQRLVFSWRMDGAAPDSAVAVDEISLTSLPLVPVGGSKTIPGDYPTITAAINDVNLNGVAAGGVTFNLTNGATYAEDLPCITAEGTAGNPITFKEAAAGTNAIIRPTGTSGTTDAGVCIQGGDFITFDGVDISALSNLVEYGYLVKNISVTNGAQNNTVKNTSITLNRAVTASVAILQSATATGGGVVPTALTGSNFSNKYYNFTIQNSYTGVYLLGTAAFPDDLNEVGVTGAVTKNVIGGTFPGDVGGTASNNAIWGVRAGSQSNAKIFNNEIRNLQSVGTGTVAGIHIDNTGAVTAVSLGTTQIFNNEIHDLNAGSAAAGIVSGIRANLTGNATSVSKIYNNFIYGLNSASTVTATRRIIGMNIQDAGVGTGATHNLHYNSVRIAPAGLATTNTCYEINGAGATNPVFNVRDNIFANFTGPQSGAAKHYVYMSTTTASAGTGAVYDFNVVHINNPVNGFIALTNATDRATLADWQTGVTQDANSKSQNPRFISASNLHIDPAAASPVENNGTPIATTTTVDFDNQARTGNTDIGADEGTFTTLLANDIEATVINTPANGSAFIIGAAITPQAVFSNVGSANQASVSVQMTITGPGGYSYAPASQAIAPLNAGVSSTQNFPVAPAFTTAGTYTATATNLFADSNAANDSFVATFTVSAPITGGTVSVGTGQAYTSLTNPGGIFDTINTSTVTSSIIVNVTSDLSGETGAISLNQFAAGFTLTIQPSGAARTISGNGNGTVLINLNGADGVTFTGAAFAPQGLTIRNTNSVAGGVFRYIADASNNSITSCLIEQNNPNNTAVIYSTGTTTGNDNNAITNSIVRGTSSAIAPFNGVVSSGTSTAISNSTLSVSGNTITDFGQAGVLMTTGTDNYTVSGNDISQTASRVGQYEAVFASTSTGTNTVTGNKIHGLISNSGSFNMGIFVGNAGTINVTKNSIYDIQTTAGATGPLVGILYGGGSAATPNLTVANNFIAIAPTVSTAQQVVGIQDNAFSGNIISAIHNTIYLGGTGTGGYTSAMVRSTLTPTTHTERNNILFNNRAGVTAYADGDESGGTGTWTSDSNFFAGTGATAANFFDYNGVGVPFATWQAGPPARDAGSTAGVTSSFVVTDIFVNAPNDLHIKPTAGAGILGAGASGTGVTTDFDNDPRPASNPDRGADELVQAVAAVIPAGTYYNVSAAGGDSLGGDVTVTNALYLNGILNAGANTLTIDCNGTVNGSGPTSYITGNLKKNYCGTGPKGFEVGTANGYSPVSVFATGGTFPSSMTIKATQTPHPSVNPATSIKRFWTLTEGGDITANLIFNYLATDVMGSEPNYKVIRIRAGVPTSFPLSVVTPNQATLAGVSEFSDWTVGEVAAPTAAPATISGQITTTSGAPMAGVTMWLGGGRSGRAVTDANGIYRFANVPTGDFYTLTPSITNYRFSPASRSFSLLANVADATFTGTRDAVSSGNVIDSPEYFVRQHYLDFLGREPDYAGLNFWSDQMRGCGNDYNCLERRTINVSAAYFKSIEFQETGALVDRLYSASYGRAPLFAEFMPDRATVARDVIVGEAGWENTLRANKEAFLNAWVERAAFHAAYDNLTNDSYVDALISNTRVTFTDAERATLVGGLTDGTLTRAQALQRVAENERFMRAKFNEAFVRMQYFGYLRRDPDDSGFHFWLNKLNEFDGNFERAEMVKAFLVSGEYRDRFRQQ